MNDHPPLERLRHAALTPQQQARLFVMIQTIFEEAIFARSPKKRPPGKAGLKAEKSYYRLLYLEGDFHKRVDCHEKKDPDGPHYNWNSMIDIMRQMGDIPELRMEILDQVESAVDAILLESP